MASAGAKRALRGSGGGNSPQGAEGTKVRGDEKGATWLGTAWIGSNGALAVNDSESRRFGTNKSFKTMLKDLGIEIH